MDATAELTHKRPFFEVDSTDAARSPLMSTAGMDEQRRHARTL